MLQWLYNEFGMVGSLIMAFFLFISFIFWIAGLAGIQNSKYSDLKKMMLSIIGIFIPPFAILWLLREVYLQHKILTSGKHAVR